MKLVVGLGNPGPRYRETRHNAGFRVLDRLASRMGIPLAQARFDGHFGSGRVGDIDLGLLEPQTFMNASGRSVGAALRLLPVGEVSSDLLVVYDDVDLPLGRLRLRARGSDGGHLGLRDVLACTGTQELPRLRFGVGRPPEARDTVDHVLQRFAESEAEALAQALERACSAVEVFLTEGIVPAMDRFNAPPPSETQTDDQTDDQKPEEAGGG